MVEKMNTKYHNISCSYYDQIEAYATKRTRCLIAYLDDSEKTVEGIITDIYSLEGAEYLTVNNETAIRLDHIRSINGVAVDNKC